jgi:hypothetical protein
VGLLDALEKMDTTCDDDGNPALQMIVSPADAARVRAQLEALTPDQQQRLTAILNAKREAYRASRGRRRLPRHGTEREFDAPLLTLLAARGFTDIHFIHGGFEFGKDVIAKGLKPPDGDTGAGDPVLLITHQYAIPSKAGDLNLAAWWEIRAQIDEARLYGLAHPSFTPALQRAAVLLTTGRLTGGAAVQAEDYRATERREGRPDFDVWDRGTPGTRQVSLPPASGAPRSRPRCSATGCAAPAVSTWPLMPRSCCYVPPGAITSAPTRARRRPAAPGRRPRSACSPAAQPSSSTRQNL